MKRLLIIALMLGAADAIAQSESYVQLPPNSTGVKLRMRCNTIGADLVCSQGYFLDDGSGSNPLGLSGNPLFVTFTNAAITANIGTTNGLALDATLAGVKTGTDKIPSSPATDRATAAAPFSTRLSDGSTFYKATTPADTQPMSAASLPLPSNASKETGGNLDTIATNTGRIPISPATDRTTAAAPFSMRLSDGAAFIDPRQITIAADSVGLATSANQTNGTQKTQLVGGGNTASIDGSGRVAIQNEPNIDAALSTRATESTLAAIKAKTDNIPADPAREGGVLATAGKQDTGNASLATIATNSTGPSSAAITMIASSQIDTQLLAASVTRKAWKVCNQSADVMLIKFGSGASQWSYTYQLQPRGCYEQGAYTGQVDAVWYPGFGGGQAVITDLQ